MLDLQLQEQATRQQAQAYARQQQQQPLQVPLQVQQQVPQVGVDQVKNKRLIRALSPNGSFVHQAVAPVRQRILTEQEVLA